MSARDVIYDDYLAHRGKPRLEGTNRFSRRLAVVPTGNLPMGEPDTAPSYRTADVRLALRLREARAAERHEGASWARHAAAVERQRAELAEMIAAARAPVARARAEREMLQHRRQAAAAEQWRAEMAEVAEASRRLALRAQRGPEGLAMARRRIRARNRLGVLYENLAAPEW